MKKLFLSLGMAFAGLFTFSTQSQASHQMASDLTYAAVAPNMYVVTLKFYRDCSGILEAATYPLSIKSPGCNTARPVVSMPKVGNTAGVVGSPYCTAALNNCTGGATNLNYQEFTYQAVVTFSAAEMACPDWTLSVTFNDGNRPTVANVSGGPAMYVEAFLKVGSGLSNNSPEFNAMSHPVPYINQKMPVAISCAGYEADGDSLSYRLVAPMSAANTNVTYKPIQGVSGGSVINPNPNPPYHPVSNPQVGLIPAISGNYSPLFPILSCNFNWNETDAFGNIKQFVNGQFGITLDSITGLLYFTAPELVQANQAANKYSVAVQIDEWRKINGVVTKVGSVRRDMLIVIKDCGTNQNPSFTAVNANNQPLNSNDEIRLRPGTPLTMQIAGGDNNQGDLLQVESDVVANLPGATYIPPSGTSNTATITWTPSATDVRNAPYQFTVRIADNACPIKGYSTRTFAARVSNSGSVTGTKKEKVAPENLVVYPNPFQNEVSFRFNVASSKTQTVIIYNALGQKVDQLELNAQAGNDVKWKNAAKFAAGQYIAKLVNGKAVLQTVKFTKL